VNKKDPPENMFYLLDPPLYGTRINPHSALSTQSKIFDEPEQILRFVDGFRTDVGQKCFGFWNSPIVIWVKRGQKERKW